jgi:hypothetical protein
MTGFFTNGVCFPAQQEAIDTYYQSQPAFSNSTNLFNYLRLSDGSWVLLNTNLSSLTTSQITLNTLTLASCESPTDKSTSFLNGVELGWAVSSVIVIAFVLRRLRRGY